MKQTEELSVSGGGHYKGSGEGRGLRKTLSIGSQVQLRRRVTSGQDDFG